MKRLCILIATSLLFVPSAFASMQVRVTEESIASGSPREEVLRNAIRSRVLSDGSEWITHRLPGYRESSPMGVTRFDRHGKESLFRASDWLPQGTVPSGTAGQVYDVTDLEGGALAAAVGWNRDGQSRNAILVLHAKSDGSYETVRVIEMPGVSSLVRGPKATIVALTDDVNVAGGGALVTVFDAGGTVLGRSFPGQSTSGGEAIRNSIRSSLQQVTASRYALYDNLRETIFVFDLHIDDYVAPAPDRKWVRMSSAANGAARVAEHARVFIGIDASLAQLPVIGTWVAKDGKVTVVRTGLVDGVPRSIVTVFRGDGEIVGTWKSKHPWNAVIRSDGEFRGVVMREGVLLEKATFAEVR